MLAFFHYNFIIEKIYAKSYKTGKKYHWTQDMLPRILELGRTSGFQIFNLEKSFLEILI